MYQIAHACDPQKLLEGHTRNQSHGAPKEVGALVDAKRNLLPLHTILYFHVFVPDMYYSKNSKLYLVYAIAFEGS